MKVRLTQALLALYLAIVSVIIRDFNAISWLLFAAFLLLYFFFSENKFFSSSENLVYVLIALSPFPYLLSLFALYLPFAVFGMVFARKGFIKSYIFGFAVSLLSTILLYTASNYFSMKLNFLVILAFFYTPPFIALLFSMRKNKALDFLNIQFKEYSIILAILAATLFVSINIVNNNSLFVSNGTYMFTKFNLIVKEVQSSGNFPIYDPATSSGESPFLFETPIFFSHLAFAKILLGFIPNVTFYNLYTLFIMFLSTLGLSLLLERIIYSEENEKKFSDILTIILGSIAIGLNFYFAQYLEAFKESFIFPINYLMFSLILEKPKEFRQMAIILCLIALSFIAHTSQGVGIVLLSFSLTALTPLFQKMPVHEIKNWLLKNKIKIALSFVIILFMSLFYIAPAFIFKDFLEKKGEMEWNRLVEYSKSYGRGFIFDVPLSLKNPDVTRNDDKKFSPFISILGPIALITLLLLRKMPKGLAIFLLAYLMHFALSAIAITHPLVGSMEYSYRTAFPYLLILLVVGICSLIAALKQDHLKYALILIFAGNLLYVLPMVRSNIENIHREQFISGDILKEEIEFAKKLPNDGRMITYGLFANAIDPAMATLTNQYLSRYHLTEYARSRSIYSKIHGTHSFGQEDFVFNKTGTELYNYLRLGGYKYIFANICHPAGAFITKELYPNFVFALYQNQCFVFLRVNNASYSEKVGILEKVDGEAYKTPEGYKHLALSPHFNFGANIPYSPEVLNPEPLEYKRISPTEALINGNFKDNEWAVFKEDYFSRWKAYMNGKEVPILATNHNSVLIKTIEGSSIRLKYSILPIERVIGALSFISALVIVLISISWLKAESNQ